MMYGWECWSGGMAHPNFGREGRMGMGTVFKKNGREGRPSEKNGRYPSLCHKHLFKVKFVIFLSLKFLHVNQVIKPLTILYPS